MALEEGEPEDLCVAVLEARMHIVGQVVVHNVSEVNLVQVVRPRVQNGEALVLDALLAILDDILVEELVLGLVSRDRIAQIVFVDCFAWVANELSDSLYAG